MITLASHVVHVHMHSTSYNCMATTMHNNYYDDHHMCIKMHMHMHNTAI